MGDGGAGVEWDIGPAVAVRGLGREVGCWWKELGKGGALGDSAVVGGGWLIKPKWRMDRQILSFCIVIIIIIIIIPLTTHAK